MMTPTLTINAWGEIFEVYPEVQRYSNGRVAVSFNSPLEGPFGTLTTNLPDQHLNEGEVFAKDWAEGEPLFQACLQAGWIVPTGREVQSGYVFPKVVRLAGPLLDMVG